MKIFTLDTTLRNGAHGEAGSFSVEDKLLIAQKLDSLGIDYIEGGWPASSARDKEFFSRARGLRWQHARLAAFGSIRFSKSTVEDDRNLKALLEAGTPTVAIGGKSLEDGPDKLRRIAESVEFLKTHGKEVIYDAEHFFEGHQADPRYALRTLQAAREAGADVLCLCDTNGGAATGRLIETVSEVRRHFDGVIGIQSRNDCDLAVANTLAAVEAGATHVQGSINGYGERCGHANLASVIANLELKLGHTAIGPEKTAKLADVCRFIAELANLPLRRDQPFVGKNASASRGDMLGRLPQDLVNRLSEDARRELLERIRQMEYEGHELEAADGTCELLVREALHPGTRFFEVESFEVITRASGRSPSRTTATVNLRTPDGVHSATAAGHGPFNALHLCLRKCLAKLHPQISEVRLTDYKVRVLDSRKGTAARARVLVEWSGHRKSWTTVGVSDNVTEASWNALVDAIRLELMRLADQDPGIERVVEDYCWGV